MADRITLRQTVSRVEVMYGEPSDDCPLCRADADAAGTDRPQAKRGRTAPGAPRRTALGLPLEGPHTA